MSASTREIVSAALGKLSLTMKIENSKVLNVYSGELRDADIGIYKDTIVYVGEDSEHKADKTIDARGLIAIPGLIDTHLHIESTMLTPANFASALLPYGTTTVFADPHEIVNVLGKEGLRMMLENAKGSPMKIYFFTPTCVPESSAVTSGAEMTPEDVEETLGWEGVSGLGEVMDFDGVLGQSEKMIKILEIGRKRNSVIDGHCPLLMGARLAAYSAAGPEADHENFETKSALEKLRAGMYLKLRGPDVLDMRAFVSALKKLPSPINILFVTDDVMPDRLALNGHLNQVCRAAVEEGLDPIEVVRGATLRPAIHMRKFNLGAIAPGKIGDVLLLKKLESFNPTKVISNGVLVTDNGRLVISTQAKPFDRRAYNSVKLPTLKEQDFEIPSPVKTGTVFLTCIDFPKIGGEMVRKAGSKFLEMVLTNVSVVEAETKDGELVSKNIAKVFVFERHGKNGNRSFGFARNLLKEGAVATTVAHDAHNLLVVGNGRSDMVLAANLVTSSGGGIAAVHHGKIRAKIDLPIAGLMSEDRLDVIAKKMLALRKAFVQMGMIEHPYMPIPFLLTLSVIPHARITDKGIFDVDRQKFLEPISQVRNKMKA
ncbi:MAG: amidohydrolase family protein [Thaumarchaeota archaeon]|nr:amidohydrolase family protein [Nitrososphaerota archaeon]